jgi:hypothetical protein
MNRTRAWRIQRQLIERSDAQTRWDQAYQHLLQWTTTNQEGVKPCLTPPLQEVPDAYCPLCPCLDQSASPSTNH